MGNKKNNNSLFDYAYEVIQSVPGVSTVEAQKAEVLVLRQTGSGQVVQGPREQQKENGGEHLTLWCLRLTRDQSILHVACGRAGGKGREVPLLRSTSEINVLLGWVT